MAQPNDQVFQLSLTEIAFTIAFILLLLLGYQVIHEQTGRQAAEAALAQVQGAERSAAALTAAKAGLADALKAVGSSNPDEAISRLIAADTVRAERDRLQQQLTDLDAKLTALTELQTQVQQAAEASQPGITQAAINAALVASAELKKQLKAQLNQDLPAGGEAQAVLALVAAAKAQQDQALAAAAAASAGAANLPTIAPASPEALRKDNTDLRGQLAFLKNKLDAKGGRDYPPCWADENGKVEFLLAVEARPDSVAVSPAWPTHRETQARALPGMAAVLAGGAVPLAEFGNRIQGIYRWSQTQNPQCRHYVQFKSAIANAVQSDRARLLVEGYFYKSEVRR